MRHAITLAALLAFAPAFAAEAPAKGAAPATTSATPARTIEIKVTDAGFEPREIRVKKGEPTKLVFTRTTEQTCITEIDIPDEKVAKFELPLNKPVALTITPKKAGVEAFHCSAMGMGNGKIIVE